MKIFRFIKKLFEEINYRRKLVKITFILEEGSESLWALKTSKKGVYKIENIPFFTRNVSLGDLVEGKYQTLDRVNSEGVLETNTYLLATKMYKKSGNMNIGIICPTFNIKKKLFHEMKDMGIFVEGGTADTLCICVTPEMKIHKVMNIIDKYGLNYEILDDGKDNENATSLCLQ